MPGGRVKTLYTASLTVRYLSVCGRADPTSITHYDPINVPSDVLHALPMACSQTFWAPAVGKKACLDSGQAVDSYLQKSDTAEHR